MEAYKSSLELMISAWESMRVHESKCLMKARPWKSEKIQDHESPLPNKSKNLNPHQLTGLELWGCLPALQCPWIQVYVTRLVWVLVK